MCQGFNHFSGCLHHIVVAKLSICNLRVNLFFPEDKCYLDFRYIVQFENNFRTKYRSIKRKHKRGVLGRVLINIFHKNTSDIFLTKREISVGEKFIYTPSATLRLFSEVLLYPLLTQANDRGARACSQRWTYD